MLKVVRLIHKSICFVFQYIYCTLTYTSIQRQTYALFIEEKLRKFQLYEEEIERKMFKKTHNGTTLCVDLYHVLLKNEIFM